MADLHEHSTAMSAAQFRAVNDELVRLTLGGRGPKRLELRTDGPGMVAAAIQRGVVHITHDAGELIAQLRAYRWPRP
jgi:hypothetical protein